MADSRSNGRWLSLSVAVLCALAGCAAEDGSAPRTTNEPDAVTSVPIAQEEPAPSVADAVKDGDAAAEPDAGAVSVPQVREVADAEPLSRVLVRDDGAFRRFEDSGAPQWPFVGVVQLWTWQVSRPEVSSDADQGWSLRYWGLDSTDGSQAQVPLAGFEPECLGRVALVSHGLDGVEVGGSGGDSLVVPWGGEAQQLDAPSPLLTAQIRERSSNVAVSVTGDVVTLGSGDAVVDYAMRVPPRVEGEWWRVQARHDGDLFVMTVHPAHLECFSGVTWLSIAATGEVVACGANTWATRFVAPDDRRSGELVLPDPEDVGTYLGCAPRLDLAALPLKLESRDAR